MNFLGLNDDDVKSDKAKVVILPVPYEETTSYMKGTENGPDAILEASSQVEYFDEELGSEPYKCGIWTADNIEFGGSVDKEAMDIIGAAAKDILDENKFLVSLGGEHTISYGLVKAALKRHPKLHVVHLDAHADMRESYEDNRWSHASVMKRIEELGVEWTSIGIRALSKKEYDYIETVREKYFFAHEIASDINWAKKALKRIKGPVYLTLDIDVFDSSVVPDTGTPVPGGLNWYQVTGFLKGLFQTKKVIAADLVELSPNSHSKASDFLAARLVYKIIGYWNCFNQKI